MGETLEQAKNLLIQIESDLIGGAPSFVARLSVLQHDGSDEAF
jgi:hypothetical protein